MTLSQNEHYVASAAYLFGGILSTVTHLWLLFEFFPCLRIHGNLKFLHQQLVFANVLVVCTFIIGTVSHFEQAWIFGPTICKAYLTMNKVSCILAVGSLASCLWAEHQHAFNPELESQNVSYRLPIALTWINAAVWGYGALAWAKYGVEPAGYTCTVLWYEAQPYVYGLTLIGFGVPITISLVLAAHLWFSGKAATRPFAAAVAVMSLSVLAQYAGYAGGFLLVVMGYQLPLRVLAAIPIWTKCSAIVHPFIYSHMLAKPDPKED